MSITYLYIIHDPFPQLGQRRRERRIVGNILDLHIMRAPRPGPGHPSMGRRGPVQHFEAFYLAVSMLERDLTPLDYNCGGGGCVGHHVAGAQRGDWREKKTDIII